MVHVGGNIERNYYVFTESLKSLFKKLQLFIKCEEQNSTLIADIADMEKEQTKDYIK